MAVTFKHNGISPAPQKFYGAPEAITASANAYGHQAAAQAAAQQARQGTNQAALGAQGGILQTLYSQPGQFAGALANAAGNATQAIGYGAQGMGQAAQGMGLAAQGLGGLGQGYGTVAQAMSNERSNWFGANAMAEAARQAGLANQGVAGMGAYGNAATAAQQTQAMQTTGYMKALSDMMAAQQAGVTGLGQANQSAVAALGAAGQNALSGFGQASQGAAGQIGAAGQGAASKVGAADMVSSALGGLMGGDGGFQATGTNGPIASGSYTGSGPGSFSFSSSQNAAGREMPRDMLRESLTDLASRDQAYRGQFAGQNAAGMDQLERGHAANLGASQVSSDDYRRQLAQGFYSQAGQPRAMLNDTRMGLQGMMAQGMGSQNAGMNQFYRAQLDPRNRGDYNPMLSGLGDLGGRISGAIGQMGGIAGSIGTMARSGANQANSAAGAIQNLWKKSLGQTGAFGGEGPLSGMFGQKGVSPVRTRNGMPLMSPADQAMYQAQQAQKMKEAQSLMAGLR